MHITEFISKFKNHPVLFIGTGVSLRYLQNSYTWDGLLSKISLDLCDNKELYYDIKSKSEIEGKFDYKMIATELEKEFNSRLSADRNGKFEAINDKFYECMESDVNHSRFKLYISHLLNDLIYKPEQLDEIAELKKIRKNIGSVITTNYDKLIEDVFEFKPLIGNDILLSNPYGSLYKIHGCVSEQNKIIITQDDYEHFNEKYELIRAQLLSLFIHNPIIFIGYAIGDENIKSILKTIFTYIEPNTPEAELIRSNFLLVEYDQDSTNLDVTDYDIDMSGFSTIRINKIKTDDFTSIYKELSNLNLPVSAMDIRKVQAVVKEIYAGGEIKVNITENLDGLKNDEKVIAIGSYKTIKYEYQTAPEVMSNYFKIIDESNSQLLTLVDKYKIATNQYFPIFAFANIQPNLTSISRLKAQQTSKVENFIEYLPDASIHNSIYDIMQDTSIKDSYKFNMVMSGVENGKIELSDLEDYLREYDEDKLNTYYRKLLCYYDYKKYK